MGKKKGPPAKPSQMLYIGQGSVVNVEEILRQKEARPLSSTKVFVKKIVWVVCAVLAIGIILFVIWRFG